MLFAESKSKMIWSVDDVTTPSSNHVGVQLQQVIHPGPRTMDHIGPFYTQDLPSHTIVDKRPAQYHWLIKNNREKMQWKQISIIFIV